MDKNVSPIPYVMTLAGIEAVDLTPEEAFVLSRVNGRASIYQISKILGFSEDQVYQLLMRAIDTGFIAFREDTSEYRIPENRTLKQTSKPPVEKSPEGKPQPLIQNEVDIDRFLENCRNNGGNEVFPETFIKTIPQLKAAYAKLIRMYHPDRMEQHTNASLASKYDRALMVINEAYSKASSRIKGGYGEEKKAAETKVHSRKSGDLGESAKRYFEMGKAAEEEKAFSSALNFYKIALENVPAEKTYQEAFGRVKKIFDKRHIQEWLAEAQALKLAGKLKEATQLFEKVLSTDLTQQICYKELAYIYAQQPNSIQRALEMGEVAREFFPNDAALSVLLSKIYVRCKKFRKALQCIETASRAFPKNDDVKKALHHIQQLCEDK